MAANTAVASSRIAARSAEDSARHGGRRNRITWCSTLAPSTVSGTGGTAISVRVSGVTNLHFISFSLQSTVGGAGALDGGFISVLRRSRRVEQQFGSDDDSRPQGPVNGAPVREKAMHPFGGRAVPFFGLQMQLHVDAADHEHSVVLFDFAYRIGNQAPAIRGNFTRLQRAP